MTCDEIAFENPELFTTLRFGQKEVPVWIVDNLRESVGIELDGYTDKCTIWVHRDVTHDDAQFWGTLFHEALHLVADNFGIKLSERDVLVIEHCIVDMFLPLVQGIKR